MKVQFDEVIKNAAAEGIDLQTIAIQYKNLTAAELTALKAHQEVTHEFGSGAVLAKFPLEGEPIFQDKVTGVLYLAA